MDAVAINLESIRQRIEQAVSQAERGKGSVSLIAVSKGHDEFAVRQALRAGQRLFGENRVQEALSKFTTLRKEYLDLELHLIGPLQTNKVEDAVRVFDVIETLDRPKLAIALAKATKKLGRCPQLYIEVNIGSEPQKAGVIPEELENFLSFCRNSCGLTIVGLMCIPPLAESSQYFFHQMKTLADNHGLHQISMGMSGDFEAAIAEGATSVRIGTAIFGVRSQPV